jgi:signal transduction histidine kinase
MSPAYAREAGLAVVGDARDPATLLASLQAALDGARIGVVVIAERAGALERWYANQASAAMLGYTVDEIWNVPVLDTIAPADLPRALELLGRVRDGVVAPAVLELDCLHRDGSVVRTEIGVAQSDLAGDPPGHLFACVLRDLTRDRSQVSLLEADRHAVVGALAAGIAHEIANPVTHVSLQLKTLRRTVGANDEAIKLIDDAYAGVERIRNIVRAVMMLAAPPGSPTAVDLGAVVQAALRMVRPSLETRARVVCQAEPVPTVHADEPRLAQAVLSMLLFAGGGFASDDPALNRVVIGVEARGDHVVLVVTDNGRDLTGDEIARVFDPSFVPRDEGGSPGFGLGMARAIAVAEGGGLAVEARPGGGVVTTLSLPVR